MSNNRADGNIIVEKIIKQMQVIRVRGISESMSLILTVTDRR